MSRLQSFSPRIYLFPKVEITNCNFSTSTFRFLFVPEELLQEESELEGLNPYVFFTPLRELVISTPIKVARCMVIYVPDAAIVYAIQCPGSAPTNLGTLLLDISYLLQDHNVAFKLFNPAELDQKIRQRLFVAGIGLPGEWFFFP